MLYCQAGCRLDLDNDVFEADEVWLVFLIELVPFVFKLEGDLAFEGYLLTLQFQLEALLVYRLEKPSAHLVVDLKTRA